MAGSVGGLQLARRARRKNSGSGLGDFLAALEREIGEDRDTLRGLAAKLGIRRSHAKEALAWLSVRGLALKPNGWRPGYGRINRLLELEALALGVTGKLSLWQALRDAAEPPAALRELDLDRLLERAERQREGLERHRRAAATQSLSRSGG